jgi:hypothetical protein
MPLMCANCFLSTNHIVAMALLSCAQIDFCHAFDYTVGYDAKQYDISRKARNHILIPDI